MPMQPDPTMMAALDQFGAEPIPAGPAPVACGVCGSLIDPVDGAPVEGAPTAPPPAL